MSYATPIHRRRGSINAYADLGLETQVMSASPVRLITLLFDGARAAVAQARVHLAQNNIAARGSAISKAIEIVESGLKASLDMKSGGELALSLRNAYDLIVRNLLLANLNADLKHLDAADRLLADLGGAWRTANDPLPADGTP